MNTSRNFLCPETEANCIEANCRWDHCILQFREAAWEEDQRGRSSRRAHMANTSVLKTEEEKLRRQIQSIGMEFFTTFYFLLSNQRINDAEAVQEIRGTRGYAEIASHMRVRESRKLISEGRTRDVFKIISQAERVDEAAR